jgi:hypothetical protein
MGRLESREWIPSRIINLESPNEKSPWSIRSRAFYLVPIAGLEPATRWLKIKGILHLLPLITNLSIHPVSRNDWVFTSPASKDGNLSEPRCVHNQATVSACLPHLSLHGLRSSFASLYEWTETPVSIAAQIQAHAPQGMREQNTIRRPLDLLRIWHIKIGAWILNKAALISCQ